MVTLLYLIVFIALMIAGLYKGALTALAVTLAVDILIALLRVGVHVTLKESVLGVRILAGPVRLKLLPAGEEKPKKPKPPKPKKEKPKKEKAPPPEGEKKKPRIKVTMELISVILTAVGELLGRLRRRISIDILTIHYTVASPDPFGAAMTFAYASAAVSALMPVIENIFRVKKSDVGAAVTFDEDEADIYIEARLTLAIWEIIYIVLAVWPVVKAILTQAKQGKVEKNGQASDQ